MTSDLDLSPVLHELQRIRTLLEKQPESDDEEIQLETTLSESSIYEPVSQAVYLVYDQVGMALKAIALAQSILAEIPNRSGLNSFYDSIFEEINSIHMPIYAAQCQYEDWINEHTPEYFDHEVGMYD